MKWANFCEHYRLAMNLGKSFNKIHGNVGPNTGGYWQRLEQTGRLESFSFIALACHTSSDKISHQATIMVHRETGSEMV